MRTRPFETLAARRWNEWRRFHAYIKGNEYSGLGFIQFETGEVVLTQAKHEPSDRTLHEKLGIQLVATNDQAFGSLAKRLRPPGAHEWDDPRASWFTMPDHMVRAGEKRSQQYLLLDVDTHTLVPLGQIIEPWHQYVPQWAKDKGTRVFWLGPGHVPQTSGFIDVWRPVPYEQEEMLHLDKMRQSVKAWCSMEIPNGVLLHEPARRPWQWELGMEVQDWTKLEVGIKYRIAQFGFTKKYAFERHRHLIEVDRQGKPYPLPKLKDYADHKV